MQTHEYQRFYEVEEGHWWFRALRNVVGDAVRDAGVGSGARVLDAGCGTGATAVFLRSTVSPHVVGIDLSPDALAFASRRGLARVCRASINALPFEDASFDAVVNVDVLECDEVHEQQACRELCRIVRPGGYLFVVIPAYRWLMSPVHHRAVHASRRYSRARARALWNGCSVDVRRVTHLFATVLPSVAAYRLWRRWRDNGHAGVAQSEIDVPAAPLNALLFRAVSWERRWLRRCDLPFGSSLLVVARKQPTA